MIILTGSDGFIGKHFKNSLESGQQLILPVDVDNGFNFYMNKTNLNRLTDCIFLF